MIIINQIIKANQKDNYSSDLCYSLETSCLGKKINTYHICYFWLTQTTRLINMPDFQFSNICYH